MKNLFKRTMSLLLAVAILLSLAVPSVFAVGTGDGAETDAVVYDFMYLNDGSKLMDSVDAIAAKYDELRWKYAMTSYTYGYEKSLFYKANNSLQMQNGAGQWFAFQIKSPGEGVHELVLEHGTRPRGAAEGRIYILPANESYDTVEEITAAVGGTSGNGTAEHLVTVDWSSETDNVSGVVTDAFRYEFAADTDYIVVFKSQTKTDVEDKPNAYMYATKLTATPVEGDTTDPSDPSDASDPSGTTSAPEVEWVTGENVYHLYQPAYANKYMSHNRQANDTFFDSTGLVEEEVLAAYDTLGWKAETVDGIAFFSSAGYTELTIGEGNYYAFRIQAPADGVYNVTLKHSVTAAARAAGTGNVYIFNADELEDSTIKAVVAGMSGPTITTSFKAEQASVGTASASGSFTFYEDDEYIVAFSLIGAEGTSDSDRKSLRAYLNTIEVAKTGEAPARPADPTDPSEPTGSTDPSDPSEPDEFDGSVYDFMYLNEDAKLNDKIDEIAEKYESLGWKFHSTCNDYAFNKGIYFHPGTNSVQMQNTAGQWYAFQIKAPGEGWYELSLEHGTRPRGAAEGRIYILPANADYDTVEEITAAVGNASGNGTVDHLVTVDWSSEEDQAGIESDPFWYEFAADTDYILVFKSQKKTDVEEGGNAYMYASKLLAAPSEKPDDDILNPPEPEKQFVTGENAYYLYQPDYAGSFLSHHRQEGDENLNGAAIVTDEFAAAYDKLGWRSETTTGIANITDKGYLEITLGESNYYAFRIKAPATGVYDVTLNYAVTTADKAAATGKMFILQSEIDTYGTSELKNAVSGREPVITTSFKAETAGKESKTGSYTFYAGNEYILVFSLNDGDDSIASTSLRAYLDSITLKKTGDAKEQESTGTEAVTGDVIYQLYQSQYKGDYLYHWRAESELGDAKIVTDKIAAAYDTLLWKYEPSSGIAQYSSYPFIELTIGEGNYFAVRVKAPMTGIFDVTLHQYVTAADNAAAYGEVCITEATLTEYTAGMIQSMAKELAPVITTTFKGDVMGKAKATGSYTMYEGKEYLIIFSVGDGDDAVKNANLRAYLSSIALTKTAEAPADPLADSIIYNLYQPQYAGDYLYHWRQEGDAALNGAQIVAEEITAAFEANGWKYEIGGGFAQFAKTNPYLQITTSEATSFAIRIKSPGTGKYDVTLKNYMRADDGSALKGDMYIFPAEKDAYTSADVKSVLMRRSPIASTTFKDTGIAGGYEATQCTGSYSFEAGKEYIVIFSFSDEDYTKDNSVRAYLSQLIMKRTGDPTVNPGEEDESLTGTVYQLYMDKYTGKYLWHSTQENVRDEIASSYDAGSQNWKYENISGSINFADGYLNVGMGKDGTFFGIRIKSPGTGTYSVTLEHFLSSQARAAEIGEIYIIEAPEDVYETYNDLSYAFARAPIMETTYELENASGMKLARCTGTYAFQESKEYIIGFYGNDAADPNNDSTTTYIYLDRMIMKRIGEYADPDAGEQMPEGVVVNASVANQYKPGVHGGLAKVDGVNYLAVPTYGKRMYVYDLDAWAQIDEVYTGVGNPRGTTVDDEGNIWVVGDAGLIFKYDIRTGMGETYKYRGSSLSSFYAANIGSDGRIYLGSGNLGHVIGFDPSTKAWFDLGKPLEDGKIVGAANEKDGYVYAAVHGDSTHYIVKMDAKTGELLGKLDVSARMYNIRYLTNIDFLGDYVVGCGANSNMGMMVVDPETMEFVSGEEFGIEANIARAVSEVVDGKQYFTTAAYGLCEFDLQTKKATPVGGDFKVATTGLRFTGNSFISGMDEMSDKTILTYGNPESSGLLFWDLESGKIETRENLVLEGSGEGSGLRSLLSGKAGTGELYMGCYDSNNVWVVDTESGKMVRTYATTGSQVDSMIWVDGTLYAGNYNTCTLTKVDFAGGAQQALFRLNDDVFNQARIHTLTYGEDKIFCGTTPDVYRHGGMLAWYDLKTGLTWVAAGPDPEDVFYTEASLFWTATEWTQEATGKVLQVEDFQALFNADQDGDGVNESFKGLIDYQTIQNVVYKDGLIYGTGSIHGGTSTTKRSDIEACIFVYDVAKRQVIATCKLTQHISGLSSPEFIQSLTLDPNSEETLFWGGVSETLFSMTFDKETLTFHVQEELSFSKTTYYANQSRAWFPRPIIFDEEGYLYVSFDRLGGLVKVNTKDTSDYVQLLKNFDSVLEIPTQMAFGDDGDLYYLTAGYGLYVLKTDPTEEEWAEAKVVQDMIDALPDPEDITAEDYEAIKAARTAYLALATANRGLINNLKILEKAEEMVLIAMIDALGEVTIDQELILAEMRENYNAMSMDRRLNIENYNTMKQAERRMSQLKAKRVDDMILAIGEVTLDKEQQIRAARAAYLNLTSSEQKLVQNMSILSAAEAQIAQLKAKARAIEKVIEKIDAIGEVTLESEEAILEAREAYDKLDDESKAQVTNYAVLLAAEEALAKLKAGGDGLSVTAIVAIVVAAVAACGIVGTVLLVPGIRKKLFKR